MVIGIVLIGLSSAAMLLTPVSPAEVRLALTLLASGAIGTLSAWLILPTLDPGEAWDAVDVAVLAACLAIAAIVLVTGIVAALPGAITTQSLAFGALVTIAVTGVSVFKRGMRGRPVARRTIVEILPLILVAGSLRL